VVQAPIHQFSKVLKKERFRNSEIQLPQTRIMLNMPEGTPVMIAIEPVIFLTFQMDIRCPHEPHQNLFCTAGHVNESDATGILFKGDPFLTILRKNFFKI